jgi:hypothetical protein
MKYFDNGTTKFLIKVALSSYDQANKTEFVFTSHSFDVSESWMLEGSLSECCKLVNCKNSSVRTFLIAILGI